MATIERRVREGGVVTYRVAWREGGGRDSRRDGETCDDIDIAKDFKARVRLAGERRPEGFPQGCRGPAAGIRASAAGPLPKRSSGPHRHHRAGAHAHPGRTVTGHNAADAPVVIDGGDRSCVRLLLELRERLARPPAGTLVHLIAADPAAPLDLAAWCHLTGHTHLGPTAPPFGESPTYALRTAIGLRSDSLDAVSRRMGVRLGSRRRRPV